MNWAAISFDWNQIRGFLATAEEGSLSAAARVLGQTQPTLGRQVAALEAELGVVLFERVGRGLALTPSGAELLAHVREMAAAAERVSLAASGQAQAVEGRVAITASDIFSGYLLPPALRRIQMAAPNLEIDIIAANEIRDLQRREADIALRHVRPTEGDLIARLVAEETAQFYASERYLAERGRPRRLADLAGHDLVAGFADQEIIRRYLVPLGVPVGEMRLRLGSASGLVSWQMVREGLGLAVMSDKVGARTPDVVRLDIGMAPVEFPVWLTVHRELNTARRIRLVYDILAEELARLR